MNRYVLIGALLVLASFWVSAYILGQIGDEHWASAPTTLTAICLYLGGSALAVFTWGKP